jgi:hypothetical protein
VPGSYRGQVVRPVRVLAALSLLSVGACRADTIRTSTEKGSTTVAPAPSSTRGGGSTSVKRPGATNSSTAAGSTTVPTTAAGGSTSTVVLGGNSLGATSLGTSADQAVASMKKALGVPSRDLKDPGATCPGPDRLVSWGRFSLYFTGGKLSGWGYDSKPAGPPQLATPSGITVGSTVATLRRVYGAKLELHGAESPFPAGFRMPAGSADLTGTLTGTTDADTTTSLAFGVSCGE